MNAWIGMISRKLSDIYHESDRIGKLIVICAGLHAFVAAMSSADSAFGIITGLVSAAVVWVMYWKLAKEHGISPMENKGKLLIKALLCNVISAVPGLLLVLIMPEFGEKGSFLAELVINFACAFLSGKVFCRMLCKDASK